MRSVSDTESTKKWKPGFFGLHLSTASLSPQAYPHAHSHSDSPTHPGPRRYTAPANSASQTSSFLRHSRFRLLHTLHHYYFPQDTNFRYCSYSIR